MGDENQLVETLPGSAKEQQIRLEEAKRARIEAEIAREKQRAREAAKERRRSAFGELSKKTKIVSSVIAIVLIVAVVGVVAPLAFDDDETQYITESTLKEAVNVESLAAVDYTYKGIAEKAGCFLWMDSVDYRVKYEAHVRASYKMSAIEFEVDDENKIAVAYLPEAEIAAPVLDETKFGYLPENVTVDMKEVLALCKEDVAKDLNLDEMRTNAAGSLQNIIAALTMPLLGDDWSLEFESLSEYAGVDTQEVQNEED